MYFYSTNNPNHRVDFVEAVSRGLAPDGGLYMPGHIPTMDPDWFNTLETKSFVDIGVDIARKFVHDVMPDHDLRELLSDVLTFDAPLVQIADDLTILELFHGPTLAFKDFGARFMAKVFSHFNSGKEITILAATSGDTGSAVAHGFLGVPGIRVVLLYPSGKISRVQEMQMATIGQNVMALEVDGTFDDCQALVKRAFNDTELQKLVALSSANSINIARLIPQTFYYARALAQHTSGEKAVFVVPSGNFGNMTAGLFLKHMGASHLQFLAATNANHSVPVYLGGGEFHAHASIPTISNAMDVGNPSNFVRMQALYASNRNAMRADIQAGWSSDDQTLSAMRDIYEETGYILDPHAAVGVHVWRSQPEAYRSRRVAIVLGTAHPAKFGEIVLQAIDVDVPLPDRLASCLDKPKLSIPISSKYSEMVRRLVE